MDNWPLNPSTLDLAIKIRNRQLDPNSLPPIKVMLLDNGQYLIRDGRHRVAAFKLNGIKQIKAYVYRPLPRKNAQE
jgi:ParB-like chromosome segregation protein Spo0J